MIKKLGFTGKKYVYMKLDFQLHDFPLEIQQQALAYVKILGYDMACCPPGRKGREYTKKVNGCLHEYLQNHLQMVVDTRLKELIENEFISRSRT